MVIRCDEAGRYFVCEMKQVMVSHHLLEPGQIWRSKAKETRLVHVVAIGRNIRSYGNDLRVQFKEITGKLRLMNSGIISFANNFEYVRDEPVKEPTPDA